MQLEYWLVLTIVATSIAFLLYKLLSLRRNNISNCGCNPCNKTNGETIRFKIKFLIFTKKTTQKSESTNNPDNITHRI